MWPSILSSRRASRPRRRRRAHQRGFTEHFTLAELKTLRAKERIPDIRPQNTADDGLFEVPTLQEVIDLARSSRTCDGNVVGIYPETKQPSYFDSIGLSMEEELVRVLHANGYHGPRAPVFIQSFEVANLRQLATLTELPLVQLINCSGSPFDFTVAGYPQTYADLVTPTPTRAGSWCTAGRSGGRTGSFPPTTGSAPTRTRLGTLSERSGGFSPPAWTVSSPTSPTWVPWAAQPFTR